MRVRGWRRGARAPLAMSVMIALAATLLLAGCGGAGAVGGSGGTGGTGGSARPTATPNLPPPCKGQPATPSGAPSATLRNSSGPNQVSLPVGAVVEIRLDGNHTWSRANIMPAGGLTPAGAQGAVEQGDCVWDFAVAQPGDTVVTFTGGARCPPNAMCPQYALLAKFTIHGA